MPGGLIGRSDFPPLELGKPKEEIGVFQRAEPRHRLGDRLEILLGGVNRLQGRIGLFGILRPDRGKEIADSPIMPRMGHARIGGIVLEKVRPGADGKIVGLAVLKANGHIVLAGRGLTVFGVNRGTEVKQSPHYAGPTSPR